MKNFFSKKAKQGFTLIELLVVIAIIGILSSVVLASLNSARVKARDARRVADIKQLQVALELYYDANGAYPAALADLVGSSGGASLPAVPKDPSSGAAYAYAYKTVSSVVTAYAIGASLETLSSATTLDDNDLDFATVTGAGGWNVLLDMKDSVNCTGGAGMCYGVSNVNAP